MKKFYKKANFTSIQISSRDDSFFNQCKEYYKKEKHNLSVDDFFVLSENDKRRFSSIIQSNYHVIGTLKNNLYCEVQNHENKNKKVLFISQQNSGRALNDFIEEEKIIFNELFKICEDKGWKLSLCTKNSKFTENSYRKNLINGNWNFVCGDKAQSSYNAVNENDIIVFTNSTLGLEALTKKKKCIAFPPDFFSI